MNKYLVKIAEKKEKSYSLEIAGTGGGAALARHNYHEGHLTGRATYYHGSTDRVTRNIKEEGIVPRKTKGIVDHMGKDFSKANEGLAFATKTKSMAHQYSAQAKAINKGTFNFGRGRQDVLKNSTAAWVKDSLGIKKDTGVSKLNVPTWKHEVKSKMVENPEVKNNPFLDKLTKHELKDKTMTHKGTISAKFVHGSKHYEKNTAKEIGQFIKHDSKRFLKGAGGAAAGAAVAGLSLHSAYKKLTKKD